MRDAASAAAMSDPAMNWHFSRAWSDPPPLVRRRPALAGTSNRADFVNSSGSPYSPAADAAQRAIGLATRRACVIDRTADLLLSVGRVDAAERLSRVAADLREVAI